MTLLMHGYKYERKPTRSMLGWMTTKNGVRREKENAAARCSVTSSSIAIPFPSAIVVDSPPLVGPVPLSTPFRTSTPTSTPPLLVLSVPSLPIPSIPMLPLALVTILPLSLVTILTFSPIAVIPLAPPVCLPALPPIFPIPSSAVDPISPCLLAIPPVTRTLLPPSRRPSRLVIPPFLAFPAITIPLLLLHLPLPIARITLSLSLCTTPASWRSRSTETQSSGIAAGPDPGIPFRMCGPPPGGMSIEIAYV